MKICTKCNTEKALKDYANHKSTRDGKANICKTCHGQYIKERRKNSDIVGREKKRKHDWYVKNKDKLNIQKLINYEMVDENGIPNYQKLSIHKFGITTDEYLKLYNKQKGVCAICGHEETTIRKGKKLRLSIDHNHETSEVRALLCRTCNNGLGCFKDDIELLEKALIYLKKFN